MDHPLDRPFWSALTTRQSNHALGDGRALRFAPDIAAFAAAADSSPQNIAALAELAGPGGTISLVEADPMPLPPGMTVEFDAPLGQMVAETIGGEEVDIEAVKLTDADAPEMIALAHSTRPGPFYARTHRLGRFIGIRSEGRLIAMAGERLSVPGFHEVSGVCTHPDHRGRGYGAALTRIVARRILDEGDTPFLHVMASNDGAIRLYEALGFRTRRIVRYTILSRG